MVKYFRFFFLIFVAWRLSFEAAAVPVPPSMKRCGQFVVEHAVSGDTLVSTGGEILALAAVKAPELWKPTDAYRSWPHAERSRSQLAAMTEGQTLELFCDGEKRTFDNQLIAHALLPGGQWLQHQLAEEGMVFVFPRATQTLGLNELYAAELAARSRKEGLWNELDLLAEAGERVQTGRFKIVTGKVVTAARVGSRLFLNFGENWRTDFTVEIPSRALRRFKRQDIDPIGFQQPLIEVRGWVTWKGGPHILLEGPGQIRVLDSGNAVLPLQ